MLKMRPQKLFDIKFIIIHNPLVSHCAGFPQA
jgi:hypothetical protein